LSQRSEESDLVLQDYGFGLAALSGAFRVLEKIFIKRVMGHRSLGFFQLHLLIGFITAIILFGFSILEWLVFRPNAAQVASMCVTILPGLPLGHTLPRRSVWFLPALSCSVIQHIASVESYMVLTMMSHLSFTIVNTMKRLFTMGSSVLFFGGDVTPTNLTGMVLAVAGVLGYNLVKPPAPAAEPSGAGPPDRLGLRRDRLDSLDEERAKHDQSFEGDLVRTISNV
jgi:multidrug transporter EmrE-like cation transporter